MSTDPTPTTETETDPDIDGKMIARAEELPLLSSLLPLKFANGAEIGGFAYCCAQCKDEIGPESIRADITALNPHVYNLEAYGLCYECKLISPLSARLADDGSMLLLKASGWSPARWGKEPRPGIISRIKSFLGV